MIGPEDGAVNTPGGTTPSSGLEVEPAIAATLFGERIAEARAFTNDLGRRGEILGLIGPVEPPRLWTRHVVNSVLVAPLLTSGGVVGDIGSGAGLPGLVLAIARPDVDFVLIEPMERRVAWLTEQVAALGLTNVRVERARAEELAGSLVVDQVTARAVSALSKLLPPAVNLTRSGGQVVLMKGAGVSAEVAAAAKVIRRLRLHDPEVITLGEGVVEDLTRVFRATVD